MTDHADLIRKLVEAGVEYSASSRYGGLDAPNVRGYDPHGSTNLTHEEEDLLRTVLGMPVERTEGPFDVVLDRVITKADTVQGTGGQTPQFGREDVGRTLREVIDGRKGTPRS